MSDDDLLLEFDQLVEKLAAEPVCNKNSKGGCTCLHILRDPDLGHQVSKFLFNIQRTKSKQEKDQMLCD